MAAVMITERSVSPRRRIPRPVAPRPRCMRLAVVPDSAPAPGGMVPTTARVVPDVRVASAGRTSRATFRRRRIGVLVGVVAVVIMAGRAGAALGSASLAAPGRSPSSAPVTRYVVQPGDSLWSVAGRIAPKEDPRAVVDALVQVRGNGPLQPGEVVRWQG